MLGRSDGFSCMVFLEMTVSPPLNGCIQVWKLAYKQSEPDLFFTKVVTIPSSVLVKLMVRFKVVLILFRMIITSLYSCGVQLFGDTSKESYQFCQIETVDSVKDFEQIFCPLNCYFNEYKFCTFWIDH